MKTTALTITTLALLSVIVCYCFFGPRLTRPAPYVTVGSNYQVMVVPGYTIADVLAAIPGAAVVGQYKCPETECLVYCLEVERKPW